MEVAQKPCSGLTLWNGRSGGSGPAGLVWTACWTGSSREGGCGSGCSARSCFLLLLRHSSLCWGSACGCCRPKGAVLVTTRQNSTFPLGADWLGQGLARDSHSSPPSSDRYSGSQAFPQQWVGVLAPDSSHPNTVEWRPLSAFCDRHGVAVV